MKKTLFIGISAIIIIGIIIGVGSLQSQLERSKPISQEQTQTPTTTPPQTTPPQTPPPTIPTTPTTSLPIPTQTNCKGTAGCYTEIVTRIVDGDTIHVSDMKIRLSLTNTPELYQPGYNEATEFTKMLCPAGSEIIIDQDDLQKKDQYGRILAKVFCGEKNLNAELLVHGLATISTPFCHTSEFAEESWAIRYGCESSDFKPKSVPIPQTSCDPSYPDFCIPPPPPDLNCVDVQPHKKFKVNPPDPHRFDGDGDGIGCE